MNVTFHDISDRHVLQAVEFANAHRDGFGGEPELIVETENGENSERPERLIIRTADGQREGFRIAQWNLDVMGIGIRGDLKVKLFAERAAGQRLLSALAHFA